MSLDEISRRYSNRLREEQTAQMPASEAGLDFWSGAVGSFVSSIPEMFGMEPDVAIRQWRNENPVADVATQLAGFAIPYGGMFKLSQVPKAARALEGVTEGTLKAFRTDSVASPIIGGALKEFYRYTPLELSRLGTGWAIGDVDMGDMFADVVLSQGIAGALGGLGGFLRAGGKVVDEAAPFLVGAEQGLKPTFTMRMAQEEGSIIAGGDPEQFLHSTMMEVLGEVPERALRSTNPEHAGKAISLEGRYVYDLENAAPDTQGMLNTWMKPNSKSLTTEELEALPWDVRAFVGGTNRGLPKEMAELRAKEAGFEGLQDLASNVVYPRVMKVQGSAVPESIKQTSAYMGGQMKKLIDDGALKQIAPDTWAGQEEGGLWFVMKRLERGGEPAEPKIAGKKRQAYQFGPAQVRQGDVWFMGKTDKISRFAPDYHKINEGTMHAWARMKDPYRQLATSNEFGKQFNLIQQALDWTDWEAARKMRKGSWMSRTAPKLAEKIKAAGNIADQASVQQLADTLYDIAAPKAWKMGSNPVYGRFYSLLEGGMKYADQELSKVMKGVPQTLGSQTAALGNKQVVFKSHDGYRPVREVWSTLTEDERQLVVAASNTQTPAKDLAKLVDDGAISPAAAKAVEELQAINRHVLGKYVLPALDEAGLGGQFNWLDGYIMPRVYPGDFLMRVVDEGGKPQWIAGGRTPLEAQTMADAIVKQAASEGKTWKALAPESRAFKGAGGEADDLNTIYRMVEESMGQSADAQEIVQKAMRRLMSDKSARAMPGGAPGTLAKSRTGIAGAPDVMHYTLDDVIAASENHYRQLMRFANWHSWQYRYGQEAMRWGKGPGQEKAYTDLMRKASQWLGREGPITNALNKMLQPVLGNVLGGKAATRIAQETNSLMYSWNLGILNPSFAVLNLLTPLQTTAPWISFMTNAPKELLSKNMQMELRFGSDGKVAGLVGVMDPLKVIMRATGMMRNPSDELRGFFDQALSDGTLAPQIFDAWVGSNAAAAQNLREAAGKGGWEFIKETAHWMANKSEQFSRTVAFNSAYILGKEHFGLEGDALYRFIRKGTENTMYGYGVMDRSRVFTGPLGSMFGLFKNWQLHFIGQMADYAGLAKNEHIFAPMIWQLSAATAIGGLGATPLVLAADGLAKLYTDEPNAFHYLQKNWRGGAGEGVYYGLPGLMGVSLQASSQIPGTDVVQDFDTLTNVVFYERAKAAWKSVGDAKDLWDATGQNPLQDSNTRDKLMAAFAPRAFNRIMSSTEGDYVRSMSTGMPTVRELPNSTKLLHAAGFNMTEIEDNYIVGEFMYKKQQERSELVRGLGQAFAEARLAGDRDEMTAVIERAITSGVSYKSVLQSSLTRERRETQGDHLSKFDKQEAAAARLMLED